MQNIHIFYSGPAMFVVTCFSVLLVSHWLQHILTWFLSTLWGTLGASLSGDLLIGKRAIAMSQGQGIYRAGNGKGKGINRAGEGVLRADYGNKMDF